MSDYSTLDRILHRLVLGSPAIAEMLHDIERGLYLKDAPPDDGRHVYVTGLARAGTTILMREIHRSGQFGSLTYADMPFVLAPNLWSRLARRAGPGPRRERAHGDGIEVDFHSPEALEEVYWRVFDGASYLKADRLVPHRPAPDLVAGYRDLVRLVLRRTGRSRYLAKNNNAILRLPALAAAMPDAIFLVVLRDPLQHAASLLAQHRRFADADPFVRDYMGWLGHHEFGATLREMLPTGSARGDPGGLDYWLRTWLAVHGAFEAAADTIPGLVLIASEALARDPAVWRGVAARIGIPASDPAELHPVVPRDCPAHDPALAAEARALHDRLAARALG